MLLAAALLLSCASRPREPMRPADPDRPAQFTDVIRQEIGAPGLRHALWGVRIEEEDGTVLADINSHTLMIPASNRKIFVAGLVNDCLGPAATLPTQLWLDGTVDGSILHGNVVIRGGGDPSLGGRYESDRSERLLPFVTALRGEESPEWKAASSLTFPCTAAKRSPPAGRPDISGGVFRRSGGCNRVQRKCCGRPGDFARLRAIVGDHRSSFRSVGLEPDMRNIGLSNHDHGRSQPCSRLRDDGRRTVSRNFDDTIAVTDAGLFAAQALQDDPGRQRCYIRSATQDICNAATVREKIAEIDSPPIYQLLTTVLKNSQNLYAEMLYRDSVAGTGPISYADARAEERRFLVDVVGIDPPNSTSMMAPVSPSRTWSRRRRW